MAEYTIYKTATGDITTCGSTNLTINDIILESDESIIEGLYEAENYKIIGGEVVEQNVSIWNSIRPIRNTMLSESDWTQFPDSPLSDSKKAEWSTYRQQLRDLPSTYSSATSIDDVVFPTEPS
tara:strand:+ start:1043 stop:1411 length:369 start_codon:yes stop_codon:yes gene_type:complete